MNKFQGDIDISTYMYWEIGLLLLSLDCVFPFWKRMSLRFHNCEAMMQIIRATERQRQRLDDWDDLSTYLEKLTPLFNMMFGKVTESEGQERCLHFQTWFQDFVENMMLPAWWETWQTLVVRIDDDQIPVIKKIGISEKKVVQLLEFSDQWGKITSAHEDEMEELYTCEELSDWDTEHIRRYQDGTPDISPIDYLSSYLSIIYFRSIWNEIIRLLSPEDMKLLNQWGQIITATQTSIPLEYAELPEEYFQK
ncbi:hypothetical protein DENIS_3095 [Desulfonema ishimotonii]|uniref:Uncharacterized protein n=1 Tax=Desulfonema ishimotonii TaxID=45657 RepID=A0A401FYQ7_9BACT|nr:hypothetical protein [Desulfonema ishimotonii]GBC62132.1 hypothetical protein DENIS_3095 [Desulfonema ishimotonii]